MFKSGLILFFLCAGAAFPQIQGVYFTATYCIVGDGEFGCPYETGNLPPGMTWGGAGTLSGIPTQAGTWTFYIAQCPGCQGRSLTVTVKSPCAITSSSAITYPYNVLYFDASGGATETQYAQMLSPANCKWVSPGSKPDWVTFDTSQGTNPVPFTVTPNTTGASRTGQAGAGGDTVTIVQRGTAAQFSDSMFSADWFDAVNIAKVRGITAGCTPTTFCPTRIVTRGEAAVLLIRTLLGNTFTWTEQPWFADVPTTHPYFPYIQKMRDLGITAGCSTTLYCPDAGLTREQSAVFVIRGTLGTGTFSYSSAPHFSDVPPSDLYFPWIQKMSDLGIAPGCPGFSSTLTYCVSANEQRGNFMFYLLRGISGLPLP